MNFPAIHTAKEHEKEEWRSRDAHKVSVACGAQELVRLRRSAEIRVVNTGPRAAGAPRRAAPRRADADQPGVGTFFFGLHVYMHIRAPVYTNGRDIYIDCNFCSPFVE